VQNSLQLVVIMVVNCVQTGADRARNDTKAPLVCPLSPNYVLGDLSQLLLLHQIHHVRDPTFSRWENSV
jgi:hypothetical protein